MSTQKLELIRTSQSWDGAELPDYLQGKPELVVMKYVFPVGEKLDWHHHPVMNYGVLVEGELTIIAQDGTEKVVHEGEAVVEMVGTVHHGENRGTVPAVLYMFYLSQKGLPLSVPCLEMPTASVPETKEIYLAGGCFWGTEHYFKQIEGVVNTEVGFANGHTENPTYQEVYTDTTGFAETVHVQYNPEVVGLEFLLQMFFKAIDPTSLNKQGHDEGTRYRTGIYYADLEDLPTIEKVYQEEQKHYQQPLAVEKLPLENFYTAEEYHQDYLDKNPTGYCHLPQSLFEFARKAKMK